MRIAFGCFVLLVCASLLACDSEKKPSYEETEIGE
jgi:hypothetical protein